MTEEQITMRQTIQETIALLKQLIQKIDYTTIRQLDWHLGWYNGIYNLEIIEDPIYDPQALILAAKILGDILETHSPKQEE